MSELTFNPDDHSYTLGGRALPSVTQVMLAAGIIDTRWYDEWSRERGSAVHLACQLMDEGDLDEETVDPRIRGYLDAWSRCLTETRAEVYSIERRLASATLGFAGTIDRVMIVCGKGFGESTHELWDIKTGAPGRAGGVQTAAYQALLAGADGIGCVRRCVQLNADGTYTMHTYRDPGDWAVFRAALTLFTWRNK